MDGQAFGQMENASTNQVLNIAEKAPFAILKNIGVFFFFFPFLGIFTEVHEFLSL